MSVVDEIRCIAPKQSFRDMTRPEQLWRASMLSYCPRKQVLAAKGVNLRTPDWLLRKFSLHSGAHENAQQWLVDAFSDRYEVLVEEPLYDPETRCGGHVDAIIVEDDIAHVVEVKSYVNLPKGPLEDSYWADQISFYYHTIADQQRWLFCHPVVMICTFEGQIRLVEPSVTDTYRTILFDLNTAWDTDRLPEYGYCYSSSCKKCSLQTICTEPIDTISEFAETVAKNQNG